MASGISKSGSLEMIISGYIKSLLFSGSPSIVPTINLTVTFCVCFALHPEVTWANIRGRVFCIPFRVSYKDRGKFAHWARKRENGRSASTVTFA